jgi:hypothetical protein
MCLLRSGAVEALAYRHDMVGVAVVLALLSTCCYGTSAVLQEQEASAQSGVGLELLGQLIRRSRWWLAVVATLVGAGLHTGALSVGPLSLVQPIGVLTLVLALPLGAGLAGRVVSGPEWAGAAAVACGLSATLVVLPHRSPHLRVPLGVVFMVAAGVVVLVVALLGLAARLPRRAAPVARAAAAGTCSGLASAMTRIAVSGAAPVAVAALLAVVSAAAGLGLAQLAYRRGGLGAPLATLILVDPVVAVIVGLTMLAEPFVVTPTRVGVGVVGFVVTSIGIWVLTRPAAVTGVVRPV